MPGYDKCAAEIVTKADYSTEQKAGRNEWRSASWRGVVEARRRRCRNSSLDLDIRDIAQERLPHPRILKSNLKIGFEIAKRVASVVVLALEA